MKKVFLLLFVSGILCVATMANAQTMLKVDVPFEFVVRGNTLPAASYNVERTLANDSTGISFVTDSERIQTRASAIDWSIQGTRLEFLKVGNTYFLTDVLTPTGSLHFPLSRKDEQVLVDVGRASEAPVIVSGK
jgi:hypothetical protein